MANTTEMLRLMRHAANLLDDCDPGANAATVASITSSSSVKADANRRAVQEAVALGIASMVLRMVAAAMDDEPAADVRHEIEENHRNA